VTTVVLVAASLAAYAAYRNVIDGVRHINVANLLGKRPPQYDTSAMNILVIGSDSRAGDERPVRQRPGHRRRPVGHDDAAAHPAPAPRRRRDQLPA